jgi:hypothetical protein
MAKRDRPTRTYSKISATLEESVLRQIRERSTNVSEFLNEAAKRQLYFDRIREGIRELERRGVRSDAGFQERFRKALRAPISSRPRR